MSFHSFPTFEGLRFKKKVTPLRIVLLYFEPFVGESSNMVYKAGQPACAGLSYLNPHAYPKFSLNVSDVIFHASASHYSLSIPL